MYNVIKIKLNFDLNETDPTTKVTFLGMAVCVTSFAWKKIVSKVLTMTLPIFKIHQNQIKTKLISSLDFLYFFHQKFDKMSDTICSNTPTTERSKCIFCNIANKLENTEILFEDEDVCVFRDIKPASDYHILTIPKRHIEDAKCLTSADRQLVEKMLATAKELISKNNLSVEDARFGYHWPPFRSVRHLHLHAIAPESRMGLIGKMVFMKDSYWFVSPEYVVSRL